jgi:hypothetical protein
VLVSETLGCSSVAGFIKDGVAVRSFTIILLRVKHMSLGLS